MLLEIGASSGERIVVGAIHHEQRVEVGDLRDLPVEPALGKAGRGLAGPGHGVAGQRVADGRAQAVPVQTPADPRLELDAPRLDLVVEEVHGLVHDAEGHATLR